MPHGSSAATTACSGSPFPIRWAGTARRSTGPGSQAWQLTATCTRPPSRRPRKYGRLRLLAEPQRDRAPEMPRANSGPRAGPASRR
jgi:hypothetical protein